MTTTHEVVIAGAGPTGLMLAAELALAGVDVAVVEPRPDQALVGSRAGGLHARTLEELDQRGVAERFLAEGKPAQAVGFNLVTLDISDFPTRFFYALGLWQNHIERILAEWVETLPVTFLRGRKVSGLVQDAEGVDVALTGGKSIRAGYLVGCDGGRSLVRKAAQIGFPGWDATTSWLIAEVRTGEEPEMGLRTDADGVHGIGPMEDGERVRVVLTERRLKTGGAPTLRELSAAMTAIWGADFQVHSPTWISRFTDMTRQAETYRAGRVLLAGDAAHIHPPVGGQGLNIGVQDAVNLGWKLAQVVRGVAPETLLDSYHAERHPVAARALRTTMAQMALRRTDARTKALGDTLAELVVLGELRKRLAAELSGLGVRYDLGEGHPLLGRRAPDLDLTTPEGPVRVYTLLHAARPLLIDFGSGLDAGPWRHRVRTVRASFDGVWDLPALGTVTPPMAVLVRPDGYVAWVGDGGAEGLEVALERWFGPA